MDESQLTRLLFDKLDGIERALSDLSTRLARVESVVDDVKDARKGVQELRDKVSVLETRVSIYAAIAGSIGAVVGTGIGGLAVHFLGK